MMIRNVSSRFCLRNSNLLRNLCANTQSSSIATNAAPPRQPNNNNNNSSAYRSRNRAFVTPEVSKMLEITREGYVDTHVHLDKILEDTGVSSVAEFSSAFFPPNLEACICVFCEPARFSTQLLDDKSELIYGAYGVHPHHASEYDDKVEARIKKLLEHPRSVAWGEIGLDYLRDISPRTTQRAVFERQLRAAVALQKPIVIHTREADHDTFDILKANVPSDWPVHVHCFTDDPQFAADLLSNFSNLYLGFTGVATFDPRPTTPPADYNQGRNARVHESIRITPLNRLLLETDGPWLRPRQTKCSIAHSGLIPLIAQKIASIKQVPVNKVMQAARQNTKNMYGV